MFLEFITISGISRISQFVPKNHLYEGPGSALGRKLAILKTIVHLEALLTLKLILLNIVSLISCKTWVLPIAALKALPPPGTCLYHAVVNPAWRRLWAPLRWKVLYQWYNILMALSKCPECTTGPAFWPRFTSRNSRLLCQNCLRHSTLVCEASVHSVHQSVSGTAVQSHRCSLLCGVQLTICC